MFVKQSLKGAEEETEGTEVEEEEGTGAEEEERLECVIIS